MEPALPIQKTIQTAGAKRPVAKKPAKKGGKMSISKGGLAQLKKLDAKLDARLGEKN